MSEDALVAHMIGRPLQLAFPERDGEGRVARGRCSTSPGLRGDRFGPSTSRSSKGEILGIAGAEGNGQVQFLRALAGVERPAGHALRATATSSNTKSPLGPLRAGVVLLSGDRRGSRSSPC